MLNTIIFSLYVYDIYYIYKILNEIVMILAQEKYYDIKFSIIMDRSYR